MAASVSRRLCGSLFTNPLTKPYTTLSSFSSLPDSVVVSEKPDIVLEKGLDLGVYKAILVGQVGHTPYQKVLKNGNTVTMLSIGTGGMQNNRTPFENQDPNDHANRCSVQWHRVTIYGAKLGDVAIKQVTPGSIVYVEGSLEMKLYSDPISGITRRIREVAVRRYGRLVFLGQGSNSQITNDLRRVGHF